MLECADNVSRQVLMVLFVNVVNSCEDALPIQFVASEDRHILLVKSEPQNYDYVGILNYGLDFRFQRSHSLLGKSLNVLRDGEQSYVVIPEVRTKWHGRVAILPRKRSNTSVWSNDFQI